MARTDALQQQQQDKDKAKAPKGSKWSDAGAREALCLLIMDDRRSGSGEPERRRALPPFLYAENVAPFLRFDEPVGNMLYAFGGRNQNKGPLSLVEMFDTWHGRWALCPPMPARRAGSTASLLPDGRMIIIGGYNEKGIAEGLLSSCDIYDPVRQCWEEPGTASPLARARWGHGCASLRGKIYAVGGCSLQPGAQPRENFMETLKTCEVYDPAENKWEVCASLQIARSGSRVVALPGDRYLAAIGGCDDVFGRAETQPTVELFDVCTGQWSLLDSRLLYPRTTAAAVALDDQRLLVVGGAPSLASAEMFSVSVPEPGDSSAQRSTSSAAPAGPSSQQIADMPEGRMGCQAAVINLPSRGGSFPLTDRRCAVVVGGERCDETAGELPRVKQFQSVHVFDIEASAWRDDDPIPEMSVPRTAAALCVGRGRISA